jgi:hypothetical protein
MAIRHRIGRRGQGGEADPTEMSRPGGLIGEGGLGPRSQKGGRGADNARVRIESSAASFSTKSVWSARRRHATGLIRWSRKFIWLFDARVRNQVKRSL